MMELWKETFHDSSRYIKLVFDTYYTPDNAFVRYHENRLIASLLSIPYEFQILTKQGNKTRIRGMYLCGLATRPEYRRKGIMSQLISEAEFSATERGYDLTFLIPADSRLREYYRNKGYRNASYRSTSTGIKCGKPCAPFLYIYTIRDLYESNRKEWMSLIADWCRNIELESEFPTILHSHQDMITVMAENENSIFLTERAIDLKYPNLAKIAAVAFPELPEDINEPAKIVGLYMRTNAGDRKDQRETTTSIEDSLYNLYEHRGFFLSLPYESMVEPMRVVEQQPYAMAKALHPEAFFLKYQDPTFKIFLMLD